MLQMPMDILTQFPVRKSKDQKRSFRDAVRVYAEGLGYPVTVEEGSFGSRNMVMGEPEKAKYLVTAHYDTCARMPVPNFITPCNVWLYCLYQLLLIAALVAVSAIAGLLAGLVIKGAASAVALAVYWILLFLLILGPANPSNANDNTSGVVTVLEIMRTLPENQRHKVCFVLFDLEEAGLIGSASYRKAHKQATDNQLVLNLDCVGDGDTLLMFPTKALKKNRKKCTSLYKACGYFGKKSLMVQEKGLFLYPSDQMNFPYGLGICALRKSKFGLYLDKIHTPKDTVLEETNINILRAALTSFLCCDAVN